MLGGICWIPSAFRNVESTIEILRNAVPITANSGNTDNANSSRMSCRGWSAIDMVASWGTRSFSARTAIADIGRRPETGSQAPTRGFFEINMAVGATSYARARSHCVRHHGSTLVSPAVVRLHARQVWGNHQFAWPRGACKWDSPGKWRAGAVN